MLKTFLNFSFLSIAGVFPTSGLQISFRRNKLPSDPQKGWTTADEASLEDIAPFYGVPSQEGWDSLPRLSPACQMSAVTERWNDFHNKRKIKPHFIPSSHSTLQSTAKSWWVVTIPKDKTSPVWNRQTKYWIFNTNSYLTEFHSMLHKLMIIKAI